MAYCWWYCTYVVRIFAYGLQLVLAIIMDFFGFHKVVLRTRGQRELLWKIPVGFCNQGFLTGFEDVDTIEINDDALGFFQHLEIRK